MKQSDFADLCAYLDGQLEGPRAAQVQELIASDDVWREAHRQMTQLDELIQACEAPAVPADLAGRIISHVRGRQRSSVILKFVRYAAPLAAAAAIVIGVLVWQGVLGTFWHGEEVAIVKHDKPAQPEDRKVVEELVVENLDFFKDYDVVNNLDTLEAIDRLEASQGS
jgi:anti-sigma factor RsiW